MINLQYFSKTVYNKKKKKKKGLALQLYLQHGLQNYLQYDTQIFQGLRTDVFIYNHCFNNQKQNEMQPNLLLKRKIFSVQEVIKPLSYAPNKKKNSSPKILLNCNRISLS